MNKRKRPGLGALIFLAFVIYFSVTLVNQQKLLDVKKDQYSSLQSKIREESRIYKELLDDFEMIGTDEYIEKIAREKLGMVKNNEKIFVDINN
ncbi:MAG: septum formation initiator family protein [Eubacteriales bacterium]|nr:septum formation initiator family protein [Eubacteriales bacterium]